MVLRAAQAQRALGLALVVSAAAVTGCGGGSTSHSPAKTTTAAAIPAEPPLGSGANPDLGDARLADCAAWRKGDVAERYGTVREIAGFAGSPTGTPGYSGSTLTDRRAYAVFANWCKPENDFATYFKLYKLYTRAAAFTPHK